MGSRSFALSPYQSEAISKNKLSTVTLDSYFVKQPDAHMTVHCNCTMFQQAKRSFRRNPMHQI